MSLSGVRSYLRETVRSCRGKGYVETITGRRRQLPAIQHNNLHSKAQVILTRLVYSLANITFMRYQNVHLKKFQNFPGEVFFFCHVLSVCLISLYLLVFLKMIIVRPGKKILGSGQLIFESWSGGPVDGFFFEPQPEFSKSNATCRHGCRCRSGNLRCQVLAADLRSSSHGESGVLEGGGAT